MSNSFIWLRDRTLSGATNPDRWKGTPYSPKFQHYWNLTIRFLMSNPGQLVVCLAGGGVLPLCRDAVRVFSSPADWATEEWSSTSLPLLSSSHWFRVVIPIGVPPKSQRTLNCIRNWWDCTKNQNKKQTKNKKKKQKLLKHLYKNCKTESTMNVIP